MKFVIFVSLLVGIATASCNQQKCLQGVNTATLGGCAAAGETLQEGLKTAKSKEEMNQAYAKFCDGPEKCNEQLKNLLSKGIDCDCLFQGNRISTLTMNQICEKKGDDYFGSLLLTAVSTPLQCEGQEQQACEKNPNCQYVSTQCAFKPSADNLKQMCTDDVLNYIRMNPTGGAFSGTPKTPTLLATVLTFCLKQDDQFCVLSDSGLPLTMTQDTLTATCGDNKTASCARSRLATVAASLRVKAINEKLNSSSNYMGGYVIANSLDNAAQDLCVQNGAQYCLADATAIAQSKCFQNCSNNCTEEDKKAPKTILESCCGATIKNDNLLSSGIGPYPMAYLYPSTPTRLYVPTAGDYDAITLLQQGDAAATKHGKSIDSFATCVSATIPSSGCVTPQKVELGDLLATIPFSLDDKLKNMLPFFIKTDLAIQLGVSYYALELTGPTESKDVMFYLDNALEKTAGMKYSISINAEQTLANAIKEKFSKMKDDLQFFVTGAFLSNNGNGASVSGVYPLFVTKEEFEKVEGQAGGTTAEAATNTTSTGVASKSTGLLVIVTVMVAMFVM